MIMIWVQFCLRKKIIKEMKMYLTNLSILANALHTLRISPQLLIRIATIAIFYAAALLISVVYIQSIGSALRLLYVDYSTISSRKLSQVPGF